MRPASIVFARGLLLTGDGAGGFPSAFALNGPTCARDEAKRGLGSSNKGMCSRSLTGIGLTCPAFFALVNPCDRRCFTKRIQVEESRTSPSFWSDKSNLSSMLIRTHAEPLSAKADGKPPARMADFFPAWRGRDGARFDRSVPRDACHQRADREQRSAQIQCAQAKQCTIPRVTPLCATGST